MKKILLALLVNILIPLSVSADDNSSDDWKEKKEIQTQNSTKMRLEYYEKYKSKGYDVSLLTSDLLDATKTEEYKFWEALKQVQNAKEIPERKAYVAKLASYGADISLFTDTVIADSGKFWELYKKVEAELKEKKQSSPQMFIEKKLSEDDLKGKSVLKQNEGGMNKNETNTFFRDRIVDAFVRRLDAIPADKLPAALEKLQKNITRQLEVARKNERKVLIKRLETMLNIVESRMEDMSDDDLLDSLFN